MLTWCMSSRSSTSVKSVACVALYGVGAFFLFFSSRRRHTRCYRDWSSDVCSSDLVVDVVLAQPVEDARDERHVRAGEDRDPDRVGVLLDHGLDDLLGRLVEPGVDDLHPRVAEGAGDDLRAAVVAVQAGLRDHDADLARHAPEYALL